MVWLCHLQLPEAFDFFLSDVWYRCLVTRTEVILSCRPSIEWACKSYITFVFQDSEWPNSQINLDFDQSLFKSSREIFLPPAKLSPQKVFANRKWVYITVTDIMVFPGKSPFLRRWWCAEILCVCVCYLSVPSLLHTCALLAPSSPCCHGCRLISRTPSLIPR